ncbi:GNAT family N-acetyltransferase [uncultured Cedecea sp.]|uniref:GNAT family N-acetyltransferase n=1 Tax=uncultured Cedecea sp. TaxID=988762 RepID=UPI002630D162|nr:GNAT family N-acetyltransferase [uncultured Cedecea sp.]
METFTLVSNDEITDVDWLQLSNLLELCGLNKRPPEILQRAFEQSQFRYLGYYHGELVATARAISDLTYASYLCDVAVHPYYQGRGWGKSLMEKVIHDLAPLGKVFIYSVPEKMDFYQRLGFHPLLTAMVHVDEKTLPALINAGYIPPV